MYRAAMNSFGPQLGHCYFVLRALAARQMLQVRGSRFRYATQKPAIHVIFGEQLGVPSWNVGQMVALGDGTSIDYHPCRIGILQLRFAKPTNFSSRTGGKLKAEEAVHGHRLRVSHTGFAWRLQLDLSLICQPNNAPKSRSKARILAR